MTTESRREMEALANQRFQLREQKRELEAAVKGIEEELAENEQALLAFADELGLDKFAVGKLTFSVSTNVVGNVTDWDQVYAFVKEHDAFHLIQRRLANAAYKEILETGDGLPGVEPFVKRSLNMRKSA